MSVLKAVGRGILYVIGLPFFLIVLVGVGTFGLFMLFFLFFKSIFLFFTGRSLDDDLPEDVKANEIKEGRSHTIIQTDEPVVNTTTTTTSTPINPVPPAQESTIEQAVFGDTYQQGQSDVSIETINPPQEQPKEEIIEEKPIIEEETKPIIEDKPIVEDKPVISDKIEEIKIGGEYTPKTGSDRFIKLDNEEEDDSGVIISYNGDDDDK